MFKRSKLDDSGPSEKGVPRQGTVRRTVCNAVSRRPEVVIFFFFFSRLTCGLVSAKLDRTIEFGQWGSHFLDTAGMLASRVSVFV